MGLPQRLARAVWRLSYLVKLNIDRSLSDFDSVLNAKSGMFAESVDQALDQQQSRLAVRIGPRGDEPLLALDIQDIQTELDATSFDFATTETEATDAACRHRHTPDVITSDVKLNQGTEPATVETIYRERGEIPVLFITASSEACKPCEPPGRILLKAINPAKSRPPFKK